MSETSSNHFFTQTLPWSNNNNDIWLASTLSLRRNLEKYNFPAKLSDDRRKQIIALVDKGLRSSSLLKTPTLLYAENLLPAQKEFLFEHFLTNQSFQQVHSGDAFILDASGNFFVALNVRDHIQLHLTECQEDLENSLNQLIKIEASLGKIVNYSFSPKFGFLTADPAACGTGLVVSVFVHLPGLIHSEKLQEAIRDHHENSITFTGLHGSPNEIIGDLLVLRNNYSLGVSEEKIITSLRTFAMRLIIFEREIRSELRKNNHSQMKDKVSRAFGLLIHSYKIEALEALNAISLLKLGLDVGWVSGISLVDLNALFFKCRRGHLLCASEEKIPQEELPHQRALYIHKGLKKAHLNI